MYQLEKFTHPFSLSDFEVWCDSDKNNAAQIVPHHNFDDGKLSMFLTNLWIGKVYTSIFIVRLGSLVRF
jgi:hypothetical protein